MQAYEGGNPMYFATPPVNLIYALNASLTRITKSGPSLEERFRLHKEASHAVKKALEDLGAKQVSFVEWLSSPRLSIRSCSGALGSLLRRYEREATRAVESPFTYLHVLQQME